MRKDGFWNLDSSGTYIQSTNPNGYNILINGTNKYLNFGSVSGVGGYGFRDNSGTIEFKNALGSWTAIGSGGGTGTVTSVSVVSANGFAGTVATATTTPAITLTTTITGLLKGNGTAISAAVANTDYQSPISLTTTGSSGAATFIGNVLNIPQYSGGGGGVTAVSNSDGTLTISPTTGAVVASIALGHANSWTGQQTFGTSSPIFSTMTANSVLFAGASGLLSQNNNNFYFQNSASTPQTLATNTNVALSINVSGDFTGTDAINIYGQYDAFLLNSQITNSLTGLNTDGATPGFTVSSSRGTSVSLSQLTTGDLVGMYMGFGTQGASSPTYQNLGGMAVFTTGATTNNLGGELRFYTKADNGSLTLQMSIGNTGAIAVTTSLAINGGTALTTTNRTGTGNLVLQTSPTLTTPVLGVASATSIAYGNQILSEQTFIGAVTGIRLQSQTTNARSFFGVVPNGTSNLADVWLFATSDITTNWSAMAWGFETTSSSWGWNAIKGGTASVHNIYFNATGGSSAATANIFLSTNGNTAVGSNTVTSLFNVGSSAQFQINSSGAVVAATGITSSGSIIFSGLSTNGLVTTSGGTGTFSITVPATGILTFLATPSSANLATAITDETGSGALVFATSPTLVTPALGTPSALVATNATGTASSLTAGISLALKSATTTVDVSASTAPSSGYVLTATSGTTATWQLLTTGVNTFTNGIATKNISDASTAQGITHGLGKTPKRIRLTAIGLDASSQPCLITCIGTYNGTTNSSISGREANSIATSATVWSSTTNGIMLLSTTSDPTATGQVGVISYDSTQIFITWTKNGSPASNVFQILWEAEG